MPVRVGFVGCGGMAGGHIENWARMREQGEDVALTAFCDLEGPRAERYATRFDGRAYTDFRPMLDREELEAVYVVVPPHAHTGAELLAARKGCALFVEKPIANSLETAQEIAAAIDKAGVVNSVGYHMRYQESGGQFVEQTTHIFDLARYLVGDVTEVYANATVRALQNVEKFNVTDVGAANLKFANGAIGTIHNTCLLQMGYTTGLHVITPELIVEVTGSTCKLIEPNRRTEYPTRDNPYQREDRIFLDAIRTGDRAAIRSPYADGLKSLAATLAANESYQTGQPVKVRA